jgi:hypothetical protein
MREIELPPPRAEVSTKVEATAAKLGLAIQSTTLKQYPGSTHWHFTLPGNPGTLEATWWPRMNRLWLGIHSNRSAAWQEEAILSFRRELGGG